MLLLTYLFAYRRMHVFKMSVWLKKKTLKEERRIHVKVVFREKGSISGNSLTLAKGVLYLRNSSVLVIYLFCSIEARMRDKINRNQTGAVKASRAHNVGRCLHDAYSLSWCETVSTSVGHEEPTQPISDNIVPITKADANLSCACITTCTSPYEPVNYRPLFRLWILQTCQKKRVCRALARSTRLPNQWSHQSQEGWISSSGHEPLSASSSQKRHHQDLQVQASTLHDIFKILFTRALSDDEKTFVFMGWSLPSDDKGKMTRPFEDLRKSIMNTEHSHLTGEDQSRAVELDLIKYYNDEEEMRNVRKK